MKITLDEEYEINSSGSGYSLDKLVVKEIKGESKLVSINICYPSTIEYALRRYAVLKNDKFEGTLREFTDAIAKTMDKFKNLNF